jgi:hypothetical protein
MIKFRTPFRFLEEGCSEEPGNYCSCLTICDAANNDVANVYSKDDTTVDITREEAIATARLFAAAPDLLTCLKETLAYATRHEKGDFADRARAVIFVAENGIQR